MSKEGKLKDKGEREDAGGRVGKIRMREKTPLVGSTDGEFWRTEMDNRIVKLCVTVKIDRRVPLRIKEKSLETLPSLSALVSTDPQNQCFKHHFILLSLVTLFQL